MSNDLLIFSPGLWNLRDELATRARKRDVDQPPRRQGKVLFRCPFLDLGGNEFDIISDRHGFGSV